MKKIYFILYILLSVLIISCSKNQSGSSFSNHRKPKLIIGIVADQMSYNYIERYWNKLSDDGLKRIVNAGFDCKNIYLDYFPTETGPGHACIYTGTDPNFNGITGNNWYNRNTGQTIYCVSDTSVNTVGSFSSDGKMSPRNLLVTTITDQLKLASNFHSKVIGISLKDRAAILPAGHMADAAYWYDQPSKYFVTSSYYMQKIPAWAESFNKKDLPDEYMNKDWNTLLPIEEYTESTPDDNNYERKFSGEEKPVFPHKLSELKYKNPGAFQYSPYGNSITKDFAIEVLKNENLGKGDYTDFLCINFASTDYVGHMYGPNSIEVEDTYLRFDKDMEELLDFVDKSIGMENVLIFLTADHGNSPNPLFLRDHKIDAGAYYENKVKDTSSFYLKKVFGLNDCVLKVMDQQIYLNRDLINNMHLNINIVEDSLANFLKNVFNEIENTYPVYKLSQESLSDKYAKAFLNGYYEKRCGELFINYKPYYLGGVLTGTEHGSPYGYDSHIPLIWYGWKIKKGATGDSYSAKSISATIAYFLNIDVGENAENKPILELTDQ